MEIFDDIEEFKKIKNCNRFAVLLIPEFWGILKYRIKHAILNLRIPVLSHLIRIVYWFIDLLVVTITGLQISAGAIIGGGLYIPHRGNIIINGSAKIGRQCTIFQGVTIGRGGGRDIFRGAADIGDYAYIGAGAKILGEIKIGSYVTVGANAVITKDIPSFCLAVGSPSRIIMPPQKWEKGMKSSFFLLEGWRGGKTKVLALFMPEATKIAVKQPVLQQIEVFIDSVFIGVLNDLNTVFEIPPTVNLCKPVLIRLSFVSNFELLSLELI